MSFATSRIFSRGRFFSHYLVSYIVTAAFYRKVGPDHSGRQACQALLHLVCLSRDRLVSQTGYQVSPLKDKVADLNCAVPVQRKLSSIKEKCLWLYSLYRNSSSFTTFFGDLARHFGPIMRYIEQKVHLLGQLRLEIMGIEVLIGRFFGLCQRDVSMK